MVLRTAGILALCLGIVAAPTALAETGPAVADKLLRKEVPAFDAPQHGARSMVSASDIESPILIHDRTDLYVKLRKTDGTFVWVHRRFVAEAPPERLGTVAIKQDLSKAQRGFGD